MNNLKRYLLMAAALIVLGLSAWGEEAASGSISGRVLNWTQDDQPVPRIEVTLFATSEQQSEDPQHVVTDEKGAFIFSALKVEPQLSYIVAVTYQDVKYFSDHIELEQGSSIEALILRVYETTSDRSALSVGNQHLFISVIDKRLRIREMLFMKNDSKYTFVSAGAEPLGIPLPAGADHVVTSGLIGGTNSVVQDNAVRTFIPISPEGEEIVLQYDIVLKDTVSKDGSYRFIRSFEYPTGMLNIFLAVPGAEMSSNQLGDSESIIIEEVEYQHLGAQDLPAGGAIELAIRLPSEDGRKSPQSFLLVVAALASVAVLTLALLKRRRRPGGDTAEGRFMEREQLLDEIARLDDEFAAGQLEETSYRGLREEKKTRLLTLSEKPSELENGS